MVARYQEFVDVIAKKFMDLAFNDRVSVLVDGVKVGELRGNKEELAGELVKFLRVLYSIHRVKAIYYQVHYMNTYEVDIYTGEEYLVDRWGYKLEIPVVTDSGLIKIEFEA